MPDLPLGLIYFNKNIFYYSTVPVLSTIAYPSKKFLQVLRNLHNPKLL